MPRSTLRGSGEPLLALSDGVNERAIRAAAARASQREDEPDIADPAVADDVNVGGIGEPIDGHDGADDAAVEVAGDAAAADAGSIASTEDNSLIEAGADEDVEDAQIDDAAVDGRGAREEDEAEQEAAEEVADEAALVQAAAAARRPIVGASRHVHFAPALGGKAPRGLAALGKGGAKRHKRRVLRDNIQGITRPAIRRLARRGGCKRISGLIYEEVRGVLKTYLEGVIKDAVCYCEHARRKTLTALDIVHALRRQGRTLYGYGT